MSTMVISPATRIDGRLMDARRSDGPLIEGRSPRRPVAARLTSVPAPASVEVPARVGSVRLTRRGRLVVFLTGLLVVLIVGVFWGAGSVASQDRGQSPRTEVVQVAPGETLWDIASRLTATGDDVRDVMYDIKRLNAFESSSLAAGQRIRVPVGG